MKIFKIVEKVSNFITQRFIELFGFLILTSSIFLLTSLLSYTPEDPNFIFPENTPINNLLGFRGSLIADLFFQSLGLISILISFSFFITGIHIVRKKKIIIVLQNTFFIILYSVFASIFFNVYYYDSFWLVINGNGGFVGEALNKTFLLSLINLNEQVAYYFFY